MGLFDFLKPEPKLCQACQREFQKLHKYNSTYYKYQTHNTPRMLGTDCLLKQFKIDLFNFKGKIVFVEPLLEEAYSFTKFVDEEAKKFVVEPLRSFLPSQDTTCIKCNKLMRFTWVTLDVIKDTGRYGPIQYKSKENSLNTNISAQNI